MKLVREPLLHFLVLGAGLFLLFALVGDFRGVASQRIVVGASDVERLNESWKRTWLRAPTPKELEGLIEDHVREEIFYREALALGLDRDDIIIRRRLRQKMEFLSEDVSTAEPSEEELRRFLGENRERFLIEPRLSFQHVYFSRDRRGAEVLADAERALSALQFGGDAELGDSFPLPREFDSISESEIGRLFGRAFTSRLKELEVGRWQGPIESGYGQHLVWIRERTEPRTPDLAEVRQAVRREWLAARRREANEELYRRLRERYTVIVEGGTDGERSAQARE